MKAVLFVRIKSDLGESHRDNVCWKEECAFAMFQD